MSGRRRSPAGQRVVPASDGLPALEAGPWTTEKLRLLGKYIAMFNQGMKGMWATRVFVDLFAGPGLNVVGADELEGSPLVALRSRVAFTHCFFNDVNPQFVNALQTRLEARALGGPVAVDYLSLDCNQAASHIAERMPPNSLVLIFVDPWRWDIHFDSIARLTFGRRADLLITLHTGSIKRGAHHVLEDVDRFIGDSGWRREFHEARKGERTRVILDHFERKLQSVQYSGDNISDHVLMRNRRGTPMYHLVHASKHPRGQDFWSKATAILPSGQRRLL
jgi:three-Cys-motif partner protein